MMSGSRIEDENDKDEGDKIMDDLCPTGFYFQTNIGYIGNEEEVMNYIQHCRKYYIDVAVGDAFCTNGKWSKDDIAIYVKAATPTESGIICDSCGQAFNDGNDIVHVETQSRVKENLCVNCFTAYEYKEVVEGDNVVLVNTFY